MRYDEVRCRDARDLLSRGVRNDDLPGYRLYSFLGHRYRVEYEVNGEVAVSAQRLTYLMSGAAPGRAAADAVPGTTYTAEYLTPDIAQFRGSKGTKPRARRT